MSPDGHGICTKEWGKRAVGSLVCEVNKERERESEDARTRALSRPGPSLLIARDGDSRSSPDSCIRVMFKSRGNMTMIGAKAILRFGAPRRF